MIAVPARELEVPHVRVVRSAQFGFGGFPGFGGGGGGFSSSNAAANAQSFNFGGGSKSHIFFMQTFLEYLFLFCTN